MYQEIMYDVYRQWLDEFDREAAIKRQLPRLQKQPAPVHEGNATSFHH